MVSDGPSKVDAFGTPVPSSLAIPNIPQVRAQGELSARTG